jgi:hypothetical protein
MIALLALLLVGQQVDTDSLRRVQQLRIERERERLALAAAIFLDPTRTFGARLAAVRGVRTFVDEQHTAGAAALALNPIEQPRLRVRALQLTGGRVATDTSFSRQLFRIATDQAAPADLRHEAVTQLASATFGSETMQLQTGSFLTTLRAAARDPELRTRRVALRALAGQNDSAGLELLRQDLMRPSPEGPLLPPAEAVQLLGVNDPAPYYELLRRLMRAPPDAATRVAAIGLLGGDTASRAELVRIVRGRDERLAARQAALGALAAGDPDGLADHIVPVVVDEAAPADLRVRGIKAVEIKRTSRDPRVLGRTPDEFDRAVERLAERSTVPAVRNAARRYVARTRSPR